MRFGRTLGQATAGAILVAGAAVVLLSAVPGGRADDGPLGPGATLTGNYLAGRHAQAERDLSATTTFFLAALEEAPNETDLLRRTFLVLVTAGRVEESVGLARRLLTLMPEAAMAHIAVVADDIRAGRFQEARERLQDLPERSINVFLAPLLTAWTLVGEGETDAALAALEPLAKEGGSAPLHDLHTALVRDMAGRNSEALRDYVKVIESDASLSLRLTQLLGGLYERLGEREKARALYGKYGEDHPGSVVLDTALERLAEGRIPDREVATASDGAAEALFDVASSLRQQNARETALLLGRFALYPRPDFPVMQLLVGDLLDSDRRYESANRVYDSIDRDSRLSWSARLRVADNLERMGRTDEALDRLRALARENPTGAEPLIDLGNILRGHKRFEEAVEAYDGAMRRIATLESRHWPLLYARGIALERSKQWPRAEADFLKALEFQPDQPYVLNYLGYSWVEQRQHLDRAENMLKKAVSLRPNDGYIVDSLGWVYYQLGRFEEAVKELERAVELRPEDPIINDHLGDAYWKVGRRQESRFQWRRSLSLDPEPDTIAAIEDKLKKGLVKEAATDGNG